MSLWENDVGNVIVVKEQLKPIHFSSESVNEEIEPLLAKSPERSLQKQTTPLFSIVN